MFVRISYVFIVKSQVHRHFKNPMYVYCKPRSELTLKFLPAHSTDIDKCRRIMSRAQFVEVDISKVNSTVIVIVVS